MTQKLKRKLLSIRTQSRVFARLLASFIFLFSLNSYAASNITVQGILKNASNQSFDFSPSSPSGITVQFRHISPSNPAPGSVYDTITDYPMTIKKGHFAVTIPIQDATRTEMSEDPVGWYVEIIGNLHPDQVVAATYRLPINELPIASVAKALVKDSLQNDMIADGSITASKLATGTINSSSMAASAVATTNIADSAVTAAKLATGSVTNTHFSALVADRLAVSKLAQSGATNDQVLSWNNSTSQWAPKTVSAGGSGTVTSITAGTGLTGGTITSTGTVAVDVGTVSGKIPQLGVGGKLTASTLPVATVSNAGAIRATAGKITVDGNGDITNITADSAATATSAATAADADAVGGVDGADVATAVTAVTDATSANTANKIVKRDASGNFSAGTISANLSGNVTGSVTGAASLNVLKAGDTMTGALTLNPSSGTDALSIKKGLNFRLFNAGDSASIALKAPVGLSSDYTLTLPVDDGANGQVLTSDGSGNLSWQSGAASGVSSVNGESGTVTLDSDDIAQGSTNRYFSDTLARGALSASAPLSYNSGTGAFSIADGAIGDAKLATGISASKVSGTLATSNIPGLDAAKITSGTFDAARLPAATSSAKGTIIATAGKITVDGSGNITNLIADSAATASTADYATLAADTENVGAKTAAEVETAVTDVSAATNANTASKIVKRDASGNFSAGTITANLTGNVTGSVTGAASLNVLKAGDTMTGALSVDPSSGSNGLVIRNQKQLTLFDGNDVESVSFRAPASIGSAYTLTFPSATGDNGDFLRTDASGNLSWGTPAVGGGGTVTSVGLTMPSIFSVANSPITSSGTLGVTLQNQSGNVVFASPANGSSGTPTFRLLDAADIPSLAASKITSGTFDAARLPAATSSAKGAIIATAGKITVDTNGDITNITADSADTAATADYATLAADTENVGAKTAAEVVSAVSDVSAATNANTASRIVKRDASGNFSAGTISANLTGNVTGSVTGAASLNVLKAGDTMSGTLHLDPSSNNQALIVHDQKQLSFFDNGDGNTIALRAPSMLTDSTILTLPDGTGSNGQFLKTDGTGTLSWAAAPGGSGTVTSVGLTAPSMFTVANSPVTNSGSLDLTLQNQSGNVVFASPVNGSSGTPTFRLLDAADIPSLAASKITSGTFDAARLPAATSSAKGAIKATTGYITVDGAGDITNLVADTATTASTADYATMAADTENVGAKTSAEVETAVTDVSAATNTNTASKIVKRDASGNFSAGTITANLTGNASGNVLKAGDTMTGILHVDPSSGNIALVVHNQKQVSFFDNGDGETISLRAPSLLSGSAILTLPDGAGSNGQFLKTDGTGVLSWAAAPGGSGTVTSVGLSMPSIFSVANSPITTTGSLDVTLQSQSGNVVFASPANGSSGAPTFRLLDAADIPSLAASKITSGTFDAARLPAATSSAKGAIIATTGKITVDSNGDITNITADSAATATMADNTLNVGSVTAEDVESAVNVIQAANPSAISETLVFRDSNASFSANEITANLFIGQATGNIAKSGDDMTGNLTIDVPVGSGYNSSLFVKNGYGISLYNSDNSKGLVLRASPSTTASYQLTFPTSAGTTGYALTTDGSGVTSWSNIGTSARSSISGTSPISYNQTTGVISIANESIDTAHIEDDAIVDDKLATSAVTTNKIADGAVTNQKIADLAATKLTGTIDAARLPAATSSAKGAIKATTGKITVDGNGDITNIAADSATTLSGTVATANGGTGQTSYTNGQLLIGNTTGNTLSKATLTAGNGVSITNGSGSITISNSLTPLGGRKNLSITTHATNPDYQLTITADYVTLLDTSNAPILASSVSLTADVTGSGANGLDTGTEAISTWYYVWIISNGTTTSSLLSTSSTAPTMPSGYTYKALTGAVYNQSDGHFQRFIQHDRKVYLEVGATALTAGSATAWTSVSLAPYIPANATRALLGIYCAKNNNDGVGVNCRIGFVSGSAFHTQNANNNGTYAMNTRAQFEIPIKTAQTIYYSVSAASGDTYLYPEGFELPY